MTLMGSLRWSHRIRRPERRVNVLSAAACTFDANNNRVNISLSFLSGSMRSAPAMLLSIDHCLALSAGSEPRDL